MEKMLNEIIPSTMPAYQSQSQNLTTQQQSREQVMEELHDVTLQYLSCADPKEARARQHRVLEGDAIGLEEEVAAGILSATTMNPVILNAPLPSENNSSGAIPVEHSEIDRAQQEGSESDIHPRRRARQEARPRPTNGSPNVLSGVSSRKRNISGMKFSPARRSSTTRTKTQGQAASSGQSHNSRNPPIQLIPAATRRKEDFRAAPPPAP